MLPTTQLTRTDIEHLPHFRQKTRAGEYSSACPQCGGKDRFLFWPDKGNYLCRQCGTKGFVVDSPSNALTFTPEQYEAWKRAEETRKQAERQAQRETIERVAQTDNATRYHHLMTDRSYWYTQGLTNATIDQFKLGYCPACPTYPQSPSHTIPIYYHGRLINIRHRLANPPAPNDKYRPETAGLPAAIFNADLLDNPGWMTIVVEGEVKAMVINQTGLLPAIGIPGAATFKEKWVNLFQKCQRVYIALDPGAEEQAQRIGLMLNGAGIDIRLCQMPAKPDDMMVLYGARPVDMFKYLVLSGKLI